MRLVLALLLCLTWLPAEGQGLQLWSGLPAGTPQGNTFLDYTNTPPTGWNIAQEGVLPTSNTESGLLFCCYALTQGWAEQLDKSIAQSTATNYMWVDNLISAGCTNAANCVHAANPSQIVYYSGCRQKFDTVALAVASDLAREAAALGEPAHDSGFGYLDYTEAAGIPDSSVYQNCGGAGCSHDYGLTQFGSVVNSICASGTVTNDVVLAPGRLTDIPSLASLPGAVVGLVYEPGDDRLASQTTAYFQQAAALLAHANTLGTAPSYKYGLLMQANYISSKTQCNQDGICPNSSPTANSDTVLGLVTAWFLGLPGNTANPQADFTTQVGYFNTPIPAKMGVRYYLTYGVAGVSTFYTFMRAGGYYGVYFAPHGVPQGCNNIATPIIAAWAGIGSPGGC